MEMADPWAEHESFRGEHALSKTFGAKYRKIDFHFHTPASGKDYRDGAATYEQIAERLQAAGIDAVFVTDHNEWAGIRLLRDACKKIGARTQVLPGVELTLQTQAICLLSEGKRINIVKFHCLALLPADDGFEDKLKSLITDNHRDTAILKQKPVERVLRQPVEEVADLVRNRWGGLFIPAHLHQGKEIEKTRSVDDLYEDSMTIDLLKKTFDAVEVRKPDNARIFAGDFRTRDGLLVPEMGCVLGSDSHELTSIGRESTYVLCEQLSFAEIREALKHRSRLLLTSPPSRHAHLVSLNVDGAFLGRQSFSLSPCMTAFIGSKGSGKTAVLEVLRYALGYPSPVEDRYLSHLLGPAGKVSLAVKSANGEDFLFVRRTGDIAPQVFSSDGTLLERNTVIPSNLNVEIRGWGETTKLATDADEQLSLIDNFQQDNSIRNATHSIEQQRSDAADTLAKVQGLVSKYRDVRAEAQRLGLKEATLQKLDTGLFTDVQTSKEMRESELALLRSLQNEVAREKVAISLLSPQTSSLIDSFEKKRMEGASTAPEEAAHLAAKVTLLRQTEASLATTAKTTVKELGALLTTSIDRIKARNGPLDEEYQRRFAELSVDEQRILTERNRVIQEISTLEALRAQQAHLWEQISLLLLKLATAFDEIGNACTRRSQLRESLIKEINGVLSSSNVGTKIEFAPLSRHSGEPPHGSSLSTAFHDIANIYRSVTEENLALQSRFSPGTSSSDVSLSIDDGMRVLFEIYPGTWKPSADLSAGQKSTAVLPLVLLAARGPIILDQPEDNLDNKYIGSTVVRMLNDRKRVNQIIITSHNASMVVMTDCELITEMIDQGNEGRVRESGFLAGPDSAVAKSVLDILDGGREALLARFKKYGRLVESHLD